MEQVQSLLRTLAQQDVKSLRRLKAQLSQDRHFLLEELTEFLLPNIRSEFRQHWIRLGHGAQ